MSKKKYWKGLEELNETPAYQKGRDNEFAEELPVMDVLNDEFGKKKTRRRDFLKMMGFSLSAATLAASCEMPVRKAIPYVVKPEEIYPGVANFYASTFASGGDYCSVVVKTREGRPIKIEGNDLSPVTQGGTSARAQASVLSLYDISRLRDPHINGEKADWEKVDASILLKLRNADNVRILSSTVLSPSTRQLIRDFQAKYSGTQHVVYEPVSYSGLLDANQAGFGKRAVPSYHFDKAQAIVGIGADFLGTWISPVEYTKGYVQNRKLDPERPAMSKHFQFESVLTTTGSKADQRGMIKPSQYGLAVLNLYNQIAKRVGASAVSAPSFDTSNGLIAKAADELWKNRGQSLVVCGVNDKNIQVVVNGINELLGNYGKTITWDHYSMLRQGSDLHLDEMVDEMASGSVDVLIVLDANPAYDLPDTEKFKQALGKVDTAISLNDRMDETTGLCEFACPTHHYLESWGDAQPKLGHYSLMQPTISPLFNTRQAQGSLLKWMESDKDYYTYLREYWKQNIFPLQSKHATFSNFWNTALHDGVFAASQMPEEAEVTVMLADTVATEASSEMTARTADVSSAASAVSTKQGEGVELVLYESVAIGDGRYANNPWLLEMPDPVSRVTWENYVLVSPQLAKQHGLNQEMELHEKKYFNVVKVEANGHSVELPVVVLPGLEPQTIGIALGFGREAAGHAGNGAGLSAYPFVGTKNGYRQYHLSDVTVSKGSKTMPVAQTQTHHNIKDDLGMKRPIVKETTLEEYKKDRHAGNEDREHVLEHIMTLYPGHDYSQGHHWGMSIDLNSCTGCGACTIACYAENNVPVVGKEEVHRVHEMSWLRIDRYFSGDPENPDVVFQPMLCQHCDNAPCENVCPVAATSHSSEGLNQMAYNRCVGTRYCQNNCPYKVRRFNWFDYGGTDSFTEGTIWANASNPFTGKKYYAEGMQEDLTRMVLNPDVVIRSRGVMEKCSFCVQRIQGAKLNAKNENRAVKDGEVKTACQQACPANAIIFGDQNDKDSELYKLMHEDERTYGIIEEINTQPSVTYLTMVKNKSEENEA